MSTTLLAKQQFVIARDVAATPERVFEAMSTIADMRIWVPMCRSARWEHPPGVDSPGLGSVRVFDLAGGMIAAERMVAWQPGRQLNYRFDRTSIPFDKLTRDYEGVMSVEAINAERSRLKWAIHFDTPGRLALLEPALRASLRSFVGFMAGRLARVAESPGRRDAV